VAEALAKEVGGQHIAIDRILEEHHLEQWDEDRISLGSFLRANEVAAQPARRLLARGVPVVLDGNFYWKGAIEDLLHRLPFPHWVFSLEAPLPVCIERDRRRPKTRKGAEPRAGDRLGAEAATQVYRMVTAVRYGTPIDATGSVEATVSLILGRMRKAPRGRRNAGVGVR
jgi:hypothetical protein